MLKCLTVKVDGTFEATHEGVGVNTDTSNSDLSAETLGKLQSLINEIQSDGYVEIHIETNGLLNFVHKRSASTVDSEDNVNAYELFQDMSWLSELDGEE